MIVLAVVVERNRYALLSDKADAARLTRWQRLWADRRYKADR